MANLLKSLFEDIRPNLLYDIAKYLAFGAIAMIVAGVAFLYRYVRGYPRDLVLITFVFAVAFLLMILAVAIARYMRRKESKSPPNKELVKGTVTEPGAYQWLHDMADRQAREIARHVELEKPFTWEHRLSDAIPSIGFKFPVRNYSVLDIGIDERVKGEIYYDGVRLVEPIIVRYADRDISFRQLGGISIEQRLTPTEANHIAKMQGTFHFSALEITITGGTGFPQVIPRRLGITEHQHALSMNDKPPQEIIAELRSELETLKTQLTERTTPKLTFEIDDRQSQVHMSGGREVRRIHANVKLRCFKSVDSIVAVRDFHASLHKRTSAGEEVIVPVEGATIAMAHPSMERVIIDDGWAINQPITPYRWYEFFLDLAPEVEGQLSREYFLRITMFAVGQEPLPIDFYVNNWNDARQSNSYITLRKD